MRAPLLRGAAAGAGLLGGALCGIALTVFAQASAEAAEHERAALWAARAPLASVLETLLGGDGVDVRVADDITDLVEGRLAGDIGEIVALLADTHGLSIHDEGEIVWVDRADRRIVDFVALEGDRLEQALVALRRLPPSGGEVVAEGSGRGLILTGSRDYVLASLARLALIAPEADLTPPPIGAARADERGVDAAAADDEDPVVLVSAAEPKTLVLASGRRAAPGERLPDGARVIEITAERVALEEPDGRRRVLELR